MNHADSDSPVARGEREIHELHQFFEDWFKGRLPDDDASYARFADVMGEGFVIVSPSGRSVERTPLLASLRGAHAGWKDAADGKIWVEDVQLRQHHGDLLLFAYVEWQTFRGETRGRQSSVLFRERTGLPNGLEWLHVHETWVPEDVRPAATP